MDRFRRRRPRKRPSRRIHQSPTTTGGGPALYAGGHFLIAGGEPANYIARWRCEQPACPADCDASGGLDFLDFLCFQNAFAAADPLADCDGSTTLDFFDFLCFQNAFAAGCH